MPRASTQSALDDIMVKEPEVMSAPAKPAARTCVARACPQSALPDIMVKEPDVMSAPPKLAART